MRRPAALVRFFLAVVATIALVPVGAAVAVPTSALAGGLGEVASGARTATLSTYDTDVVTVDSAQTLVLAVTSGRTDGTAAKPVSVTGLGSWTEVRSDKISSGNLRVTVYESADATGSAAIRVAFAAAQQNLSWSVVSGPSGTTVLQSASAPASSVTLPRTPGPGSAVLGFLALNSTSQAVTGGTGYTEGTLRQATSPSVRTRSEWRADPTSKVGYTTGTSSRVVVGIELGVPAAAVAAPPGPTVAVIGDSLTHQGGVGVDDISNRLAAAGFPASNTYVYGIGGKKISAPDAGGMTTPDNVAAARAKLGRVDEWVIALGTNNVGDSDAAITSYVTTVMNAIGPTEHVHWIGLAFYRVTNASAARVNPLLSSTVGARSNGRFEDWNAYIHDGRDERGLWVYPTDATHMTAAGYAIRNDYYVSRVLAGR